MTRGIKPLKPKNQLSVLVSFKKPPMVQGYDKVAGELAKNK